MSNVTTKPYLLRAIYEWCVDQGFTPYIAVAVDDRCVVPREYVKDGQIVLNVGPEAAHKLSLGNDLVTCAARFSGVAFDLAVPVDRVAAIYARENGHGMAFEVSVPPSQVGPGDVEQEQVPSAAAQPPRRAVEGAVRPHLVRVK